MNRKVVLITIVVFLLFIGAGVVGVLALGTSTGLAMGGTTTAMAVASAEAPLRSQAGFIRNNSPWPVTITSIEVDDAGAAEAPLIYLSENNDEPPPAAGVVPVWATTPVTLPYTLPGGEIRFFGFAMVPQPAALATFDTITVKFEGPVPFEFESSYSGVALAASAGDFPADLVADDPREDESSVDLYLTVLRAAILSRDVAQIQRVIGPDATEADATAIRDSQAAYVADMPVDSESIDDDARAWRVQFFATDVAVDALPAMRLTWSDFRWSAALAN
ncbi:hypothetical protein B0I08_101364 [Glaciihabitans tibetensis]|uniref:Uncharacterized protein n=1 Tax=Glaciihabitans tibetensis TaxID=1266600 RepID=A0A2T0VJ27_9MICO|nr:hypothetical protein [Glaciihabitans tibetensis]PRY70236.1 hypothetical protein B0I08_101364 [Glaciihabitans tibetensis]